jgi:hypothetical protein
LDLGQDGPNGLVGEGPVGVEDEGLVAVKLREREYWGRAQGVSQGDEGFGEFFLATVAEVEGCLVLVLHSNLVRHGAGEGTEAFEELAVVPGLAQECANFRLCLWLRPSPHNVQVFWDRPNAFLGHTMSQVVDSGPKKVTLGRLELQASISMGREDPVKVAKVFPQRTGVYSGVVKVRQGHFIQYAMKHKVD